MSAAPAVLVPGCSEQLLVLAVHLLHHAEKQLIWLLDLAAVTRAMGAEEWHPFPEVLPALPTSGPQLGPGGTLQRGPGRGFPDIKGGLEVHQHGTMRMGDDPAASVTDRWSKVHGHDNLYIADSSVHVTNGGFNPVLTIMALSFRTAQHIMDTW